MEGNVSQSAAVRILTPPEVISLIFLQIVVGFFFLSRLLILSHILKTAQNQLKKKENKTIFQEILADRIIIKKQVPNSFPGTI